MLLSIKIYEGPERENKTNNYKGSKYPCMIGRNTWKATYIRNFLFYTHVIDTKQSTEYEFNSIENFYSQFLLRILFFLFNQRDQHIPRCLHTQRIRGSKQKLHPISQHKTCSHSGEARKTSVVLSLKSQGWEPGLSPTTTFTGISMYVADGRYQHVLYGSDISQ